MSTDTAEYHFERRFDLPADKLWHLLTDAKLREKWSGPENGVELTVIKQDFRRHGIERHRCGPADSPEYEVETRWYRINAPTDAVFTESIEAGGQDVATSLVSYRVTGAQDEPSLLHVAVAVSSFVGADACAEFKTGWDQALSNLEAFARRQTA